MSLETNKRAKLVSLIDEARELLARDDFAGEEIERMNLVAVEVLSVLGNEVETLTFRQYQREAVRTEMKLPSRDLILKNALGLAGESGEYVEDVKHAAFHGKTLNLDNMRKELGDVLWYVAASAEALGLSLAGIARANVEKLRARYPNGYSHAASAARADERRNCLPGEKP